jgi:hypothetical protein
MLACGFEIEAATLVILQTTTNVHSHSERQLFIKSSNFSMKIRVFILFWKVNSSLLSPKIR